MRKIFTIDWNIPQIRKFLKLNGYKALVRYMVAVVEKKLPLSPIYMFHDFQSNNYDNNWWNNDDPRYKLLVEINKMGLVTVNAQEGSLPGEKSTDGFKTKNSLDVLCPIEFEAEMITFLRKRGKIVMRIVDPDEATDNPKTFKTFEFVRQYNDESKYISYYVDNDGTWESLFPTYIAMFARWWGEPRATGIRMNVSQLHIFDSNWDRPVNIKGGVFRDVVEYLSTSALRKKYGMI